MINSIYTLFRFIPLIIFLSFNHLVAAKKELSIPLLIDKGAAIKGMAYPLGVGIPFPLNFLKKEDLPLLKVTSDKSGIIFSNIEIRSLWHDKSIQWIWIDFEGSPYENYKLILKDKHSSKKTPRLKLVESKNSIHIDTKKIKVSFDKNKSTPTKISIVGDHNIKGDGMGVYLINQKGETFYASGNQANLKWKIESNNPQRAVIRVEGDYVLGDRMIAKMILRYDFSYNQNFFKMEHRLLITEDTSKVWFKEYGITMPTHSKSNIPYFGADGKPVKLENAKHHSTWIFQKDYPRWSIHKKVCHVGHDNNVSSIFQTADGWAESYSQNKKTGTILGIKDFRETFPKELLISRKGLTAKLWSGRGGIPLDYHPKTRLKHFLGEKYLKETYWRKKADISREKWREEFLKITPNAQGSARTHTLICSYYSGERNIERAQYINDTLNSPPEILADPNWSLNTGIFPKISARNTKMFPREEKYISKAFDDLLYRSKDYPLNGWYSFGLCPALQYVYENIKNNFLTITGIDPNIQKYIPALYRLSYIEGYNTTRHVWYLWVRSGERKYLNFLEKQNNAIIDYRISNYGPERGLINNSLYQSPTYWPGKIDHYNLESYGNDDSFAPLWMDYYLRDNRSAKETLEYFTEAVKRHWNKKYYNNIKPDELCQLLLSTWRVTKDDMLLKKAHGIMHKLLDPDSAIGIDVEFFKYKRRHKIPPGPKRKAKAYRKYGKKVGGGIYEYARDFAIDEKPSLAIKRAAEELFDEVAYGKAISYQNYLPLIMLDHYEKSGEKEYLGAVTQMLISSLHKDFKDGYFKTISMYQQVFPLYIVPHIIKSLEKNKGVYPDFPIIGNSSNIKIDAIYLMKKQGVPILLRVGGKDIHAKVYDQNGKGFENFRFTELPIFNDILKQKRSWYELEIPRNAPTGTYKINFSKNNFVVYSSNAKKLVMHAPFGMAYNNKDILFNKKCFFYIPENQNSFKLKIYGSTQVYNPNGHKQTGKKNDRGETIFQSKSISGLWYFILDKKFEVHFIDTLPLLTMGKSSKFFIPKRISKTRYKTSYLPNWVFIKKGSKTTRIIIRKANTKPMITFLNGNKVPEHWIKYDSRSKVANVLLEDNSNEILSIRVKDQDQIQLQYPETAKVMSFIPNGMLWNKKMPKTLFFKANIQKDNFQILQNLNNQELSITPPTGNKISIKGRESTLSITNSNKNSPWSVSMMNEASRYHYFSLNGILPIVAYDKNSLFDLPLTPEIPFKEVENDTIFTKGVFEEALHLNNNDKLKLSIGKKTENNSREHFNPQKGTIEFFFMLNSNPRFSKAQGIPFAVPVDKSEKYKTWQGHFMSFKYKNALLFMLPGEKSETAARFGPWNMTVGMIKLKVARWYHLAVSWDCKKSFMHSNKQVNKFICKAYLDGKAITFSRWRIDRMKSGFSAPLPGEFLELISNGHDIIIDELRISHKPRIELDEDPIQSYPVPNAPFTYDENTSILMHFDTNFKAIGKNRKTIPTQWKNIP